MQYLYLPFIVFLQIFIIQMACSQEHLAYEASQEHPYGQPNPEAPSQISDWAPLIGESICTSISRGNGQEWGEPTEMIWRWKYIMNGHAVQDETMKEDKTYAGSIRQYIPDSAKWYVHFYSFPFPSTTLPAWEGGLQDDGKIILYRDQTAPNGMEGKYKINFYDITDESFKWLGEWVTPDESFSFPTWRIECKKTKSD